MKIKSIKHDFIKDGMMYGHNAAIVELGGHNQEWNKAMAEIKKYNTNIIYFCGEEPLEQAKELAKVLLTLTDFYAIIKTEGTIIPAVDLLKAVSYWIISPPLHSTKKPLDERFNYDAIEILRNQTAYSFSFEIKTIKDMAEVLFLKNQWRLESPEIYIKPLKESERIKKFVLSNGFNICPQ